MPNSPSGLQPWPTGAAAFWRALPMLAGAESPAACTCQKTAARVLSDIAAMAEAAVDDDESEEDSEGSYMELVEYLRFAVLNVYMDSRQSQQEFLHDPGRPCTSCANLPGNCKTRRRGTASNS